jgi:uncharacterized protein YuzE/propanediol dehydratase small subunit
MPPDAGDDGGSHPDGGGMDAGMKPDTGSGMDASPDTGQTDGGDGGDGGMPATLLGGNVFGFSTVPPTGSADVNPYGLAVVPAAFPKTGMLQPGDILLSNFNDPANEQGTGTTIVRITAAGARSTFFTSALPGLSRGLVVLQSGLVLTGNVPNTGSAIGTGALQVLDGNGNLVQTITDATLLEDPWDLTVYDQGGTAQIFVSNVVSGTVTRLDVTIAGTTLTVNAKVQIASGYATRPDANAFVVGPGGMVYDPGSDTLYLASSAEKVAGVEVGTIFSIPKAGSRTTDGGMGTALFADAAHLHGPIGMVLAPNGNLVVANSDAVNADPNQPSELVEITTGGQFVRQISIDPNNGAAFGLTVGAFGGQAAFAALNDNQSTLTVWETGEPYHAMNELSSVPPMGPAEVNPYGIAFVPAGFPTTGTLQPGDMIWSNFNDPANTQGTGTTIVRLTPAGARSTFFTSTLQGLSAGLAVLKSGLVVTGNVPNTGSAIGTGALQVLDGSGNVVKTITDAKLLEDPWDLTVNDNGGTAQIFVSNVVSGTVTRLDVTIAASAMTVNAMTQIASGYATRPDANAFVVGPGGMVYDAAADTLYLASTNEKVGGTEAGSIFAIPKAGSRTDDAGMGTAIFMDATHLHGPIGLVRAPSSGNLIFANSDAVNADPAQPSELVEITIAGQFVRQVSVDPNNGAAFGLTIGAVGADTRIAVLNDNQSIASVRSVP